MNVVFNEQSFRNTEAAFQAQKFVDHPEIMAKFSNLTGEEAFRMAREYADLIRSDWREINVEVMREVLYAKVEQHPQIAGWLEATGRCLIVERTPVKGRDAFWADDCDGSGKNMLGKLWMEIRANLRNETPESFDSEHIGWQEYQNFLERKL